MITLFHIKKVGIITCIILFFSGLKAQSVSLDSLFIIAKNTLSGGYYSEAIELYEQCLKQAREQKDLSKTGNAFIGIGIAYDRAGSYDDALQYYFKALQAYEQAGNSKKQAGTLKNLGNTYRVIKTYDKAYSYFQLSLKKFASLKDSTGIANVLNDIGIMYMDKQRNKDALLLFKEVAAKYNNYADPRVIAYAYNNSAIIYSRMGLYKNALSNYTSSLQLMKKTKEEYGIGLVLINLGDLYNRQGKYLEGLKNSKEGLLIAQKISSNQLIASAYKNIADSYKHLADFKLSNFYLDKLLLINDTIFSARSAKSYAEMDTRYQNEKKQKEIMLLKQDNSIKSIQLDVEQRTRYFLVTILAMVIIVSVLLYRSYSFKQKLNKTLRFANEKLDEANQSKIKLISIITHDLRAPVSNLFNFLQLQKDTSSKLSSADQEKFKNKINAAAENVLDTMEDVLIWSKSQMETFSAALEKVNINELFEEMISLNSAIASYKKITLVKNSPDDLNLQTDPNFIKIVLRNILSNSLKVTPEGGNIELVGFEKESSVVIILKDSGHGISPDHLNSLFNWNSINSQSTGLGLKLAKEFTEKLNGSITVHSHISKGTEFILTFPCKSPVKT